MAASKYINLVCCVAAGFMLFLTFLFMNGEKLGIQTTGSAADSPFTADDLRFDWDASDATRILLTGNGADIQGSGAYVQDGNVYISCTGKYILSGELQDGSVILDADKNDQIWLLLDGVSLRCETSAALLVEQAKKVFLTLADESQNSILSGAGHAEEATENNIDGAIYSRDDLTINGNGLLNVTGGLCHGIVCNDDLAITGGTIEVTAIQDGIHAHDSVRIADASLSICAGDDGITVSNDERTGSFYARSGRIEIPSCYEGIEASDITIDGGSFSIVPTDDGINAGGDSSKAVIRITGGEIEILNATGRDADGLDSNGDILISGGSLFVSVVGSGGNCAIDYGSESGGVCKISGGTVIAAGGSMMAEGLDASSKQGFYMYNTAAEENTEVTLSDPEGTVLLSATIPYGFSSLTLSAPGMQIGETYLLSVGGTQEEITIDNASSGMGSKPGMRMGFQGQNGLRQGRPVSDDPSGANQGRGPMPEAPTGAGQDRGSASEAFMGTDRDRGPMTESPMGTEQGRGWERNRQFETAAAQASSPAFSAAAVPLTILSFLFLLGGIGIAVRFFKERCP